jgi:hypothetical protein
MVESELQPSGRMAALARPMEKQSETASVLRLIRELSERAMSD